MTIEEFARRIKKLMADIPQPFSNYLAEAIAPEVKAKVKEIFDKWVNNYYASYSPIYYSRTYGLRDAYVCEVYGNLLVFESDASLLNGSHRVSNAYIYDRMFFHIFIVTYRRRSFFGDKILQNFHASHCILCSLCQLK